MGSSDLRDYVYTEEEATNAVWVTVATAMIFLMQAGFALVENGSVREKNSSNILIKNLFDACFGAISYWLVGFGFAYGATEGNKFIGLNPKFFAGSGFETHQKDLYLTYIFQFSFAATSATIVSGSMAERT
jgi:Amt family ammonium transporter